MEIALVRHGQTDWNRRALLQGTSDIPLNATGRAQAEQAARLLSDEHWTTIVSSPLARAAVTADIIASALCLEVVERDPALVERAYGEAEGLTKQEATTRFGTTSWPGTEAFEHLKHRAELAIDSITGRHDVDGLVIVTHGTFIRAFADAVTHLRTQTPDNAESVRFAGRPGDWQPVEGLVLR